MLLGRASVVTHSRFEASNTDKDTAVFEISGIDAHAVKYTDVDVSRYTFPRLMRQYLNFAELCSELCDGKYQAYLNTVVVTNIILAGLLVGLQTYESLSNDTVLDYLNDIVLAIFVAEFFLKVTSYGDKPWKYFTGRDASWNCFDFVVILLCMPFIDNFSQHSAAVVRIVTRLFRLARLGRLLHEIPTLHVLFSGLMSGLKSISYIFMLLLLLFYMYAIVGVYFFRKTDPFFFRDIPTALMTLFKATTLENWTDCMRITMQGCKKYQSSYYFLEEDLTPEQWAATRSMYRCVHPRPFAAFGLLYWVSFTVVSSLIMLSLFVAVITINMQHTLDTMRAEVEAKNKRKLMLKKTQELVDEDAIPEAEAEEIEENEDSLTIAKSGGGDSPRKARKNKASIVMSIQEARKHKKMLEMKTLLIQAWSGTTVAAEHHQNLDLHQSMFRIMLRRSTLVANEIVEHQYFQNFIIVVILLTSVLVGLEIDMGTKNKDWAYFFYIFEQCVFSVFALEVLLRMAAEEFTMIVYFSNYWNIFDFAIVLVSQIPGAGTRVVVMLRLARMLRILKLIKSLPQLAVIVNALLIGLNSITYVGLLIFLFYYVFAIFGVLLFSGNDPFHFSTLHMSLFSLFNIATLNNWSDVMYMAVYGCDVYPPNNVCENPRAFGFGGAVFFVLFIIIGSFVLLTLFVGVVTTSMEEATKIQMVEKTMEQRAMEVCKENFISHKELGIYRRVFGMLDLDGSGTIEAAELLVGLSCLNIKPSREELDKWILDVDINSDGVIDVVEFVTFMIAMKKRREAPPDHENDIVEVNYHDDPNDPDNENRQSSSSSSSSEDEAEKKPAATVVGEVAAHHDEAQPNSDSSALQQSPDVTVLAPTETILRNENIPIVNASHLLPALNIQSGISVEGSPSSQTGKMPSTHGLHAEAHQHRHHHHHSPGHSLPHSHHHHHHHHSSHSQHPGGHPHSSKGSSPRSDATLSPRHTPHAGRRATTVDMSNAVTNALAHLDEAITTEEAAHEPLSAKSSFVSRMTHIAGDSIHKFLHTDSSSSLGRLYQADSANLFSKEAIVSGKLNDTELHRVDQEPDELDDCENLEEEALLSVEPPRGSGNKRHGHTPSSYAYVDN